MVMQKPLGAAALFALLASVAEASGVRSVIAGRLRSSDEQVSQVPIPPAQHLGSAGYPELPAVSAILGIASETLRSINSQTDSLEKRMMEAQAQNQAKMARQKEIFEQKLKGQEETNRQVVAANDGISKEITALQNGNAALRQSAKELGESNKLMRNELRELQSKLGVARAFIATALTSTDDSHAKELDVLMERPPAVVSSIQGQRHRRQGKADPKDDDDKDDEDDSDDSDDDDDRTSLLALGAQVRHATGLPEEGDVADALAAATAQPKPANPRDLLQVLSRGIESLAQEEKQSEVRLRTLFLQQYQAGARRHAALISQQKILVGTRAQLKALQGKLRVAQAHLEDTKTRLEQRLRAVGLFMQKLSHLALAPAGEAARLMEALPAAVTIPEAEKPSHF